MRTRFRIRRLWRGRTPEPNDRLQDARFDGDAGVTLIEVLLAAVILATVVVGLVTGILTAIKAAETHRRLGVAESVLRKYVETIETTSYKKCAVSGDFPTQPAVTGYTVSITAVAYWNQGTNPPTYGPTCSAASDSGAQRVSITVTDPAGRATQSTDIIVRSSS